MSKTIYLLPEIPDFKASPLAPNNPQFSLLDAALAYAECGWYVLPCHYPIFEGTTVRCSCGDPRHDQSNNDTGKHPFRRLVLHGFKDATTNPDLIRQWWTQYPDCNIGLATCNFFGFDIDERNNGRDSLRDLLHREKQEGSLNDANVTTGGDGLHWYFRLPSMVNVAEILADPTLTARLSREEKIRLSPLRTCYRVLL